MKISFKDNWKKYLIKKARQITERELAFIDHHQGVGQALKYVITFNPYHLLLLPVVLLPLSVASTWKFQCPLPQIKYYTHCGRNRMVHEESSRRSELQIAREIIKQEEAKGETWIVNMSIVFEQSLWWVMREQLNCKTGPADKVQWVKELVTIPMEWPI